jgi:hypothetical protein
MWAREGIMMRFGTTVRVLLSAALAALFVTSSVLADDRQDREIADLKNRLATLERRITQQEDVEKIRTLAFSYGYYMDNGLYDHVKMLLSPNVESCEISGYGVFKGLKGCKRLWGEVTGYQYGGDKNRVNFGWLVKHYMIKDVITVAPDGKTAKARFDYLGYGARLGEEHSAGNQMGIYNMGFVKEEGIWKIAKFAMTFNALNYNERDFVSNPRMRCENPLTPPDAPSAFHHPFPENAVVPFHYANPVTGAPVPDSVIDVRYWKGYWPGESSKDCGKRPNGPSKAEAIPTRQ